MGGWAGNLGPDGSAFQIRDAANAFAPEQFEAPGVHARQDGYRSASINSDNQRWRKLKYKIQLTVGEHAS